MKQGRTSFSFKTSSRHPRLITEGYRRTVYWVGETSVLTSTLINTKNRDSLLYCQVSRRINDVIASSVSDDRNDWQAAAIRSTCCVSRHAKKQEEEIRVETYLTQNAHQPTDPPATTAHVVLPQISVALVYSRSIPRDWAWHAECANPRPLHMDE